MLVGALFALPFILFSMSGGYLADRFSKRTVTIGTKIFEIGVMLFRHCRFRRAQHAHVVDGSVFGKHSRSAFRPFQIWVAAGNSAGKPTVVGQRRHRTGNISGSHRRNGGRGATPSLVWESSNLFRSFLSGMFCGRANHQPGDHPRPCCRSNSKKFQINFLGDLWKHGKQIRKDRVLWLSVAGNTYFFFWQRCFSLTLCSTDARCCRSHLREAVYCKRPLP